MNRRLAKHLATALSADMFIRSPMQNETTISAREFAALREAAIAKHKLPELLTWQRNRKIIITGGPS